MRFCLFSEQAYRHLGDGTFALKVGFPQQSFLIQSGETQRTDTYEQVELFWRWSQTLQHIFQTEIGTAAVALLYNLFGKLVLQSLHMNEAYIHFIATDSSKVVAVVEAGQLYISTVASQLMEIKFSTVKAPEIVDYRDIKLYRIVSLEIQTLIALHSEGCRMAFGKRIASETFHLSPYLCYHLLLVAESPTVGKKLISQLPELIFRTVFATHSTPQNIRFVQRYTSEMVSHLDYIFLVYHDAVGLFEQFSHLGMQIHHLIGIMITFDILLHHAGLGHTRTYDRTCGHQSEVVRTFQLTQQLAHCRTFDVKTAYSIGLTDFFCQKGIFQKLFDSMNVNMFSAMFGNKVQSIFDMP